MQFRGVFHVGERDIWYGVIIEKMKVPHEYEAERITKGQMSARTCRAV